VLEAAGRSVAGDVLRPVEYREGTLSDAAVVSFVTVVAER
jgi:hypothetical protein